jgi:hypothetical protein
VDQVAVLVAVLLQPKEHLVRVMLEVLPLQMLMVVAEAGVLVQLDWVE